MKCFSQFDFVNFDNNSIYIKLLGIQKSKKNLVVLELFLLLIICLHRAVLNKLGLWKTAPQYFFQEGNFKLEKCDQVTAELIEFSLSEGLAQHEEGEHGEEKINTSKSLEELITNEESFKRKYLLRHELRKVEGGKKIKTIFNESRKIIKARQEVFKDNDGQILVKLRQDNVRLRLSPIDQSDNTTTYPANRLVNVENVVEEIFQYPNQCWSVVFMSFKRYFFYWCNLHQLFSSKRTAMRKRVDVYTYMFFCEFLIFVVFLFFFTEFAVRKFTLIF